MSRLIIEIDVEHDESIQFLDASNKLYKTIHEALISAGMRAPRGTNLTPHSINASAILFMPVPENETPEHLISQTQPNPSPEGTVT